MKPKFSKSGTLILAALSIFVVVMLLVDNLPKLTGKNRPPVAVEDELDLPPRVQPTAPPPQTAGVGASGGASPDFDLLRERLGRDDPFAPLHPVEEKAAPELPNEIIGLPALPPMVVENPPDHRLSAIATRNGKGIAIINGEILREGDFIGRFTVREIASREVILQSGIGEKIILTIRPADMPNFSTFGGVISNIPPEAKELIISDDGFINVSPRNAGAATGTAPILPPPGE